MKAFLLLLLIAICACNSILSEVSNAYLKKHAPFKVYEPSKNPFRNWTDEEIRNLFKVELRPIKKEEKVEIVTDFPDSFDARDQAGHFLQLKLYNGDSALPLKLMLYFLFNILFHVMKITMDVMVDILTILGIFYTKMVL